MDATVATDGRRGARSHFDGVRFIVFVTLHAQQTRARANIYIHCIYVHFAGILAQRRLRFHLIPCERVCVHLRDHRDAHGVDGVQCDKFRGHLMLVASSQAIARVVVLLGVVVVVVVRRVLLDLSMVITRISQAPYMRSMHSVPCVFEVRA